MLDPESITVGGLSVATLGFMVRSLWVAHVRRQERNETDLDAMRAAEAAELKGEVKQLRERLEGVAASHRDQLEVMKRELVEHDTRLAFREGKYGSEPLTNPGSKPSQALVEYRAAQMKKLTDADEDEP